MTGPPTPPAAASRRADGGGLIPTAIGAPLLMTRLFASFTGPEAALVFPGAPFLAASLLGIGSAIQLIRVVRARGLGRVAREA